MRKVILWSLLCIVASPFDVRAPYACRADTLAEFMGSSAYRPFRHNVPDRYLTSSKYLPKDSNLAKLFASKRGALYLLDWIGISALRLSMGEPNWNKKGYLVSASRTLYSDQLKKIELLIVVPHPKYKTTSEVGLLKELNALKPPGIKISYEEEVSIRNFKGTMYDKIGGGCALLIPTAQGGYVNLTIEECKLKEHLVKVALQLDFERLNTKLSS